MREDETLPATVGISVGLFQEAMLAGLMAAAYAPAICFRPNGLAFWAGTVPG